MARRPEQNGRISTRSHFLTVRQSAALAVAALGVEAAISGLDPDHRIRQPLLGRLAAPNLPSETQLLSLLVGLALLALTPRLWRGTRTAVSLTIGGLIGLAALNAVQGRYDVAAVELGLGSLLVLGRGAFSLGCGNRLRLSVVCAAIAAWGLAYCALLIAPLVPVTAGRALARALHHSVTHALHATAAAPRLNGDWTSLIEVLIACAALISVLALRSLLRPAPADDRLVEHEHRAAREIIERYGMDSLSPFVLRPDKALAFGAGGVLSYRVIGGTAIVSSDPVAPPGMAPEVLASFLEHARQHGWQVALWGASGRHLDAYRQLGLRAICVGEEAIVDPRRFTLEGRPVRKLRQSVHRVQRRGWEIVVREGRELDPELEAEIDTLEAQWRSRQRRLYGFAMGMGRFEADVKPDDLYVVARSPEGRLGAAMRFVAHCGNLSLDTMRRVDETPNGLNEALVAAALQAAGRRGVEEVSLNYAGLGHVVRGEPSRNPVVRSVTRVAMASLGSRFQMQRLVRFNDKFSPDWRPRYLVYESRALLPRSIVRVLQAEGYLPERHRRRRPRLRHALPRALPGSPQAKSAG
jgi:lysyl-tRNA synthetase, class II